MKEFERRNHDAPLKLYFPAIEKMNVNELVLHAKHKIVVKAKKAFNLSTKLKKKVQGPLQKQIDELQISI